MTTVSNIVPIDTGMQYPDFMEYVTCTFTVADCQYKMSCPKENICRASSVLEQLVELHTDTVTAEIKLPEHKKLYFDILAQFFSKGTYPEELATEDLLNLYILANFLDIQELTRFLEERLENANWKELFDIDFAKKVLYLGVKYECTGLITMAFPTIAGRYWHCLEENENSMEAGTVRTFVDKALPFLKPEHAQLDVRNCSFKNYSDVQVADDDERLYVIPNAIHALFPRLEFVKEFFINDCGVERWIAYKVSQVGDKTGLLRHSAHEFMPMILPPLTPLSELGFGSYSDVEDSDIED